MSSIFFGDSITEGSNSKIKFSDFFEDARNEGVSGTTFGEYSIYPVDGYSLLEKYKKTGCLSQYNNIFLEYGANDVSAIMCGFITLDQVIINFIKALDGIKQLAPNSKIYFLSISGNIDIIKKHSELQCRYLKDDYFKGYNFRFPVDLYTSLYVEIITSVNKRIDFIPMVTDISFFDNYLSSDNLHPNEEGHKIIADNIKSYMKDWCK